MQSNSKNSVVIRWWQMMTLAIIEAFFLHENYWEKSENEKQPNNFDKIRSNLCRKHQKANKINSKMKVRKVSTYSALLTTFFHQKSKKSFLIWPLVVGVNVCDFLALCHIIPAHGSHIQCHPMSAHLSSFGNTRRGTLWEA